MPVAQAGTGRTTATFMCGNQVPQAGKCIVFVLFGATDARANDEIVTNSNHLIAVSFPF